MGKIGHISQFLLYSPEDSTSRRVLQELLEQRPEVRKVLADPSVLEQVKEFELTQIHELGGFAENTDENMEQLAVIDTVSATLNARSFLRELDQTLKQAWRYSRSASLCIVSLDEFNELQKNYSALTSNSVLRIIADSIKKAVRPGDIVCRYSGADFAVVFPETDAAAASIIAERIRETIATQVVTYNWNPVKLTASLGIATYPSHAYERDELISIAMQAVHVSKSRGGDRVCTV